MHPSPAACPRAMPTGEIIEIPGVLTHWRKEHQRCCTAAARTVRQLWRIPGSYRQRGRKGTNSNDSSTTSREQMPR